MCGSRLLCSHVGWERRPLFRDSELEAGIFPFVYLLYKSCLLHLNACFYIALFSHLTQVDTICVLGSDTWKWRVKTSNQALASSYLLWLSVKMDLGTDSPQSLLGKVMWWFTVCKVLSFIIHLIVTPTYGGQDWWYPNWQLQRGDGSNSHRSIVWLGLEPGDCSPTLEVNCGACYFRFFNIVDLLVHYLYI